MGGQGWCQTDTPGPCMDKKPSVSNFEIVTDSPPCDERCPVGVCEKFGDGEEEEGNCRWFFGSVTEDGGTYTPSHYKCVVDACSKVPKHADYSECVTEFGKTYYRISDRSAPCQKDKAEAE